MCGALVLLATAAALAFTAEASQSAPSLTIAKLAPLAVRGASFGAGEAVKVTLTIGGRQRARRSVRAGGDGSFSTRFSPLIATDPCRGWVVVRAEGASGSRATAKRQCRTPDPVP